MCEFEQFYDPHALAPSMAGDAMSRICSEDNYSTRPAQSSVAPPSVVAFSIAEFDQSDFDQQSDSESVRDNTFPQSAVQESIVTGNWDLPSQSEKTDLASQSAFAASPQREQGIVMSSPPAQRYNNAAPSYEPPPSYAENFIFPHAQQHNDKQQHSVAKRNESPLAQRLSYEQQNRRSIDAHNHHTHCCASEQQIGSVEANGIQSVEHSHKKSPEQGRFEPQPSAHQQTSEPTQRRQRSLSVPLKELVPDEKLVNDEKLMNTEEVMVTMIDIYAADAEPDETYLEHERERTALTTTKIKGLLALLFQIIFWAGLYFGLNFTHKSSA